MNARSDTRSVRHDPAQLGALIDIVQQHVDAIPGISGSAMTDDWRQQHDAHRHAAGQAIVRLISDHGARYSGGGANAERIRLAGISSSCTSGTAGLLNNWLAAARRKAGAA